jgi:hypothetical protein
MMPRFFFVSAAVLLLSSPFAVLAHGEDHEHPKGQAPLKAEVEHQAHDHAHTNDGHVSQRHFATPDEAVSGLKEQADTAEHAILDKKYGAIHGIYPDMIAAITALEGHAEDLDSGRKKRLLSALAQLREQVESLHENSHAELHEPSLASVRKVKAAVQLVDAYAR